MAIFTFEDLENMKRGEAEFFAPHEEFDGQEGPDESSVDFVLSYSKAVSNRPSSTLGRIHFVLN